MNALVARIELLQQENDGFDQALTNLRGEKERVALNLEKALRQLAAEKKDRDHFERLTEKLERELEVSKRKSEVERKAALGSKAELEKDKLDIATYAENLEKQVAQRMAAVQFFWTQPARCCVLGLVRM